MAGHNGGAGGRPPGSSNKNSKFLLNRLKAMYGDDFDPVMKMAENAMRLQAVAEKCYEDDTKILDESEIDGQVKLIDKITTANNAISAWDRIAKYTTPQLKSIEITSGEDEERFVPWQVVQAAVDDDGVPVH